MTQRISAHTLLAQPLTQRPHSLVSGMSFLFIICFKNFTNASLLEFVVKKQLLFSVECVENEIRDYGKAIR